MLVSYCLHAGVCVARERDHLWSVFGGDDTVVSDLHRLYLYFVLCGPGLNLQLDVLMAANRKLDVTAFFLQLVLKCFVCCIWFGQNISDDDWGIF